MELARTATLVPDLERKISLKENDIAYLAGEYPNKIARSRLLQEFNSPEHFLLGCRLHYWNVVPTFVRQSRN